METYLDTMRAHPPQIKADQTYVIDRFKPGDETGISQCYFLTYGDRFPLDYVYTPADILAANLNGSLYSIVARTERGDIVSHASLFPSAPNPKILEGGGLMVLPDYRSRKLASAMTPRTLEELPRELGLDAVFVQAVCSHTYSQKGPAAAHFHPVALETDVLRHAATDQKKETWTSLLDMFRVYTDHPHTVYLPACATELISTLYRDLSLKRTLTPCPEEQPAAATRMTSQRFSPTTPLRMTLEAPGHDLADAVSGTEKNHPGTRVFQVVLPLHDRATPWATAILKKRGYFISGLLPLWDGGDCLMLQKVTERPDFDAMQTLPQARTLFEAVRTAEHTSFSPR